ncbi:MAG TPA: D-TA family PLP-dependent enzyme [Leeuwenhoekiella sp.]|nr:D-TA family PLP-dependent enzyme [Leeuwenhoekiella sp.]
MKQWFEIGQTDRLLTPALLFYPERIARNIEKMIHIAGSATRLRPHVKTYKCAEVVSMQMDKGIQKFKCATLAEAEMLAKAGAQDILVAYPLVGPAQLKFLELGSNYSKAQFSVLIDHPDQISLWEKTNKKVQVFIDIDVGMHRTGIPMRKAQNLFDQIGASTQISFKGWHIYDGHIHDKNTKDRKISVTEAYSSGLEELLTKTNTKGAEIICGGSITFPIHADFPERTLSPGTTLLWDQGYTASFPDLPFDIAATVATRIISKPGDDKLCLDLGHKAVASEMKTAPVFFPQLPDANIEVHSEEHLVIKTNKAESWNIGDILYGFPWHICPTVALHNQAAIIENKEITDFWSIEARNRMYAL